MAVSRQILHSNVLSWLLLSAEAELLDAGPAAVFSGAAAEAAEPEAGGAAAVAIDRTAPLKKRVLVGVTPQLPNSSRDAHKTNGAGVWVERGDDDQTPELNEPQKKKKAIWLAAAYRA